MESERVGLSVNTCHAGLSTKTYNLYKLFIQEQAMRTVTASEAKRGLALVIETAAREPVVIQRQKRDVAVVLSMQEYERLTRLNVTEFQRFCDRVGAAAQAAGMSEDKLTDN